MLSVKLRCAIGANVYRALAHTFTFHFPFNISHFIIIYPLVAQLDNAADSDSEERGFESLRAGQKREH